MTRQLLFTVIICLCVFSQAHAGPFLVSDPNTTADTGAVYQLEIDDVVDPAVRPVESDGSIKEDVQEYAAGQTKIRVRVGNPWPSLSGVYKWSEWSDPFNYAFPSQPSKQEGIALSK